MQVLRGLTAGYCPAITQGATAHALQLPAA
jgi:hypothetical protein